MNKEKIKKGLKWFYFSFIWLIVVVFVLDIVSKWAVQNSLSEGDKVYLIPNFLFITLHHNLGASFGLGSEGSLPLRIMWICISVVLSGALIAFYVIKRNKLSTWYKVAISLMIAGAVGNMIDRMFYWKAIVGFDGVIDWIGVYLFNSYQFPFFNIADSSLVIGVIIIVVLLIIELIQDSIQKGKDGAYSLPPEEYEKKQKEKDEKSQDK